MTKSERSVYTPIDFIEWRESQILNITPKFQRRSVWTYPARSFFIDTLLRDMPVPPIYLRVVQSSDRNRIVREVVDGQQRISAVLDFIDGKFRLSQTLDAPWKGRSFKELTQQDQQRIRSFSFSAEVFHGISDSDVLGIFARLNTYSVPLNAQELRNGRYFGYFKQSAYSLAHEHLEFWRQNRIFTERNIARMSEVELTSELMIAQIDGMQDKKKNIDRYYARFEDEFSKRTRTEERFRQTIDTITDVLEDQLKETEFRRPPFFYTLFCVVFHHLYGLPKQRISTPKKKLSQRSKLGLREAVVNISEKISIARLSEPVPERYSQFVSACLSQTDNIKPRQIRFTFLHRNSL